MGKKNKDIITLKISNGHQIWVIKGVKQGYKYFGIYTKPIKEVKKNGIPTTNS